MRRALVLLVACAHGEASRAPAISAARADFEKELAPYGRWEDDARYGARWCPRDPPAGEARFLAFQNYGHFAQGPQGGPRWVSARPGTWLETTSASGAWVYRGANDEWCWIPSHDPQRLAWKSGGLYVGWAPTPPSADEIPDRAWSYTLLGLLLDPWLTTLSGEARTDAAAQTRPSAAPTDESIATARAALLVRARAEGLTQGSDLPPAQSMWALLTGAPKNKPEPPSTPIGAPTQSAQMPKAPTMEGLPAVPDGMGLGDLGQLQGLLNGLSGGGVDLGSLLGDAGLPVKPPPKK